MSSRKKYQSGVKKEEYRQNKKDRRMTSIARKINWLWVWKQFGIYLSTDITVFLMVLICWCINAQISCFGVFQLNFPKNLKIFTTDSGVEGIVYHAVSNSGRVEEVSAGLFFQMVIVCVVILGVIQLLNLLRSILFDARAVRRQLHPLNELAKKAEEISSIAYDEDKYHILEDAISQVHPEEGEDHLNVGDEDLQGLELAVNNLIDRMKESYRQQSRFVSDASHELRTPISVIQGYVNMLDRWGKEDETVLEEAIAAIKHESEHMSKLVEQLLFLARSDSGRNKMTMEDISLSNLMKEVYEESKMIDEGHLYQFKNLANQEVRVVGDTTMLKQTMRILAENAAKYTKAKDEIIFGIGTNVDGDAFFYVQDTGVGMSENDVVHVFERFYRSDEARNSKTGGTGLGLSIAKWIVDKHKGHFDILSRKELGTRITVFIPENK